MSLCRLVGPPDNNLTLTISEHNDLAVVQDKVTKTRITNCRNTLFFLNSYNHSEAISITENECYIGWGTLIFEAISKY